MLMTIRANTLLVRQPYVDDEFLADIRERQREGVLARVDGARVTVRFGDHWMLWIIIGRTR